MAILKVHRDYSPDNISLSYCQKDNKEARGEKKFKIKFNSICHRPFFKDFLQFVALVAPSCFLNPTEVSIIHLYHDTNHSTRIVLTLPE